MRTLRLVSGLVAALVATGAQATTDSAAALSVATILGAPEAYQGKTVTIRGTVVRVERAVFPNGRLYYTLSVGDERQSLTVFSWSRPPVGEGDVVEATGVFHVWLYNLHHMIHVRVGSGLTIEHPPRGPRCSIVGPDPRLVFDCRT